MPENRIFSVPGSFEDSIQFDPGLVCIQRIIGDGQGIGVINLTPPKLNDSISGKSIQVMLDHRVPGYIMTSVQPDLPPCVTAINQTPQDSCLDAKSHGMVSMGVHEPTESDRETSHGTVSMGSHSHRNRIARHLMERCPWDVTSQLERHLMERSPWDVTNRELLSHRHLMVWYPWDVKRIHVRSAKTRYVNHWEPRLY